MIVDKASKPAIQIAYKGETRTSVGSLSPSPQLVDFRVMTLEEVCDDPHKNEGDC